MSRIKKFSKSVLSRNKNKTIKISPLSFLNENTVLKDNVYIDRFCVIHNSEIDSYSYLGYGCKLNNVKIGRYCSLASDIKIGLGKHPTHLLSTSPIFYSDLNPLKIKIKNKLDFNDQSERTVIGHDVWIGANVIIMDGVKIGDGAIIGAGSIVTKDVEPFSIVAGIPAKMIKKRFDDEMINEITESNWWLLEPEEVAQLEIYDCFRR
ncbi:CatB-related O-acetyltransferase [Macrococcus equi]|uniref:CatB-related O-acetyltransferase n=1 Tax=Macrococcus equi TaxID=3395462 RepID=UPI0039BE35FE